MRARFWANVGICVLLGVLAVFGITRFSAALTSKGLFVTDPQPDPEVAALLDKVRLVDYNLSEQANHMVRAAFVVSNTGQRDVKNLEVVCEFFDPEQRFVDRKTWLLSGRVPAGKTMQHNSVAKRFVHSRADSIQCRLVDLALAGEPAFVLHRQEGGEHGGGAASHGQAAGGHGTHGGHAAH